MNNDITNGIITFFNDTKGFGFISSSVDSRIYFHVSDVRAQNFPPKSGKEATFSVETQADGRKRARDITLLNTFSAETQSQTVTQSSVSILAKLNNADPEKFECHKNGSVRGFRVEKSLGRLEVRSMSVPGYFWPRMAPSVGLAQEELIARAKRNGANAVINFYYHRVNGMQTSWAQRGKGFFDGYYRTQPTGEVFFWVEGEAVILKKI